MTKRERILELIRVEVAKEGKATHYAMRLYVENRIGREAFDKAVWSGLRLHEDLKRKGVIPAGPPAFDPSVSGPEGLVIPTQEAQSE